MSELSSAVDLTRLTPRGRAAQVLIGERVAEGFKEREIADELGLTPSSVSGQLAELRLELLFQSSIFPPLSHEEYEVLEADILAHGVQVPIIRGRHLSVIDGRHRISICERHQLDYPELQIANATEDEERELAISLNVKRRQLSREQRRKLLEVEIMRDPKRSDNRIASLCGVHNETVATVRAQLAAEEKAWKTGEKEADVTDSVTSPPVREDTLGRMQPASRSRKQSAPPALASLDCECGRTYLLFKRQGVYVFDVA